MVFYFHILDPPRCKEKRRSVLHVNPGTDVAVICKVSLIDYIELSNPQILYEYVTNLH
jgi:hypothetical protein